MKLADLKHVIREVGERTGLNYFYVIGSAAVFASLPKVTDPALVATRDVDVLPAPKEPAREQREADRLDRLLGEGSAFDEQFGYYVQGVDSTTPTYAPTGWRERAVPVRSGGFTALCMELHDLALSKYGAGRDKDREFTRALVLAGALDRATLEGRLKTVAGEPAMLALMAARIARDFAERPRR